MRFRLFLLLLVVCYNPIMIRASPILSIGAYPSNSASSLLVLERIPGVALPAADITDSGKLASGSRRRQLNTPPTADNTGTLSTDSMITYSQTNNATALRAVASPTTTQGVSSPVVDTATTVSMTTGTNTSPAASTSSTVPSYKFPPLPPLLQWFQCVVVTIFAVAGCIHLVRRKNLKALPRPEDSCHGAGDVSGVFYGHGRTCGSDSVQSWLPVRLSNVLARTRLLSSSKMPPRPTSNSESPACI